MSQPPYESLARPRDDHFLGIYDSDTFRNSSVVSHVRAAVQTRDAAVLILPADQHEVVEDTLVGCGVDVQGLKDGNLLTSVDAQELADELLADSVVDPARFRTTIDRLLGSADEQSSGLSICADVHGALWEAGSSDVVLELERLWNAHLAERQLKLLCLYPSRSFQNGGGDEPFLQLCREHVAVEPVENFASIVPAGSLARSLALLEQQQSAHLHDRLSLTARYREIQTELDRLVRVALAERMHLEEAIASRDLIGQAKGIIMVRWHIDADAAFEMLREASNRSNRKLRYVAQAVVSQQLRR